MIDDHLQTHVDDVAQAVQIAENELYIARSIHLSRSDSTRPRAVQEAEARLGLDLPTTDYNNTLR